MPTVKAHELPTCVDQLHVILVAAKVRPGVKSRRQRDRRGWVRRVQPQNNILSEPAAGGVCIGQKLGVSLSAGAGRQAQESTLHSQPL